MLSKNEFARNKMLKIVAYAIVVGFALMMFLPTSINLPDIIRSLSGGGSAAFISVNGVDIYQKQLPNEASIEEKFRLFANSGGNREFKAILLAQLLQNWDKPIPNQRLEEIRSTISRAVLWQINLELAKDSGYNLSKEKLQHFISKTYNLYLKERYLQYLKIPNNKNTLSEKEYREEHFDLYSVGYSNWANTHLKNQYLVDLFSTSVNNGTLPVLADLEMKYKTDEHQVKVDFALYTYKQFLNDPSLKKKIKENEVKEFYTKQEEKITTERAGFTSLEKANDAKADPELFKVEKAKKDEKSKQKKYPTRIIPINKAHPHFSKLSGYNAGDKTDALQGEDKNFYVYRIITKSKSFEKVKNSPKEYQKLVTKFTKTKDFTSDFEKRAGEVMNAFLKEAKTGKPFKAVSLSNPIIRNVRVGRTEFFAQDAFFVTLEKLKNKKESLKDFDFGGIDEFLSISRDGSDKYYNREFFKAAFALKKNELSSKVLSHQSKEISKGKKVFFVIRKVDEKVADFSKAIPFDKKGRLYQKSKNYDAAVINSEWVKYIMKLKGYKVRFNIGSILRSLNLKIPKIPGKKRT